MKMIKKISIVVLALILIVTVLGTVSNADNYDINAFEGTGADMGNVKNLVDNGAATAITVARIVCAAIALIVILVIAMKYMLSAPGDRADIKKHAVHYVIGAVILFGASGILGIIGEFAEVIKTS